MEEQKFRNDFQTMTFPKAHYMCYIPYPAFKVYYTAVQDDTLCVCVCL